LEEERAYKDIVEKVATAAAYAARTTVESSGLQNTLNNYLVSGMEISLGGIIHLLEEQQSPLANVPMATLFVAGIDFSREHPEFAKEFATTLQINSPPIFHDTVALLYTKLFFYMKAVKELEGILGELPEDLKGKLENLDLTNDEE
jgi:hypothetical protein